MCKKIYLKKTGGFMHCTQLLSCPLLDLIGGSQSGLNLQFCRGIKEESKAATDHYGISLFYFGCLIFSGMVQ